MQSKVNDRSVTRESDANPKLDPPEINVSLGPSRSSRVKSVPIWHKVLCYIKSFFFFFFLLLLLLTFTCSLVV